MVYAHTLLFICPECNLPVSVSRVASHKNLEDIESNIMKVRCDYCEDSFETRGYAAKMHWVTEWEWESSFELNRKQATAS